MKLSDKIRILRKARGLSQEQFGFALSEATDGVSRQTVSDWENGKFEPKLDNIRDIAKVLNVSFDVLLDESVDLNDEKVLKSVLSGVMLGAGGGSRGITTKISYDIRQYLLAKKDYVKFGLGVAVLVVFVASLILLLTVGQSGETVFVVFAVMTFVTFCMTLASVINIRFFIGKYKHPYGIKFAELNDTHLIVRTFDVSHSVVCIPIEKIKDIRTADGATQRHGDLLVLLDGREKPIMLHNVAFPQRAIEFFKKQLKRLAESDDTAKIVK